MPIGQLPGLWVPEWWPDAGLPAFGSACLIDAAGEKIAMCGRVRIPGGGTKNINQVGFNFGAVTVPALTTLTVSLQDMLLTNAFPDEIQDQSVTIPTGSIVPNAWSIAHFTPTRSVTNGDRLAVVWEFLNFVATASIVLRTLPVTGGVWNQECYAALKSGAGPTWAVVAAASIRPNLVFTFDDGTFGTLDGAGGWETLLTEPIHISDEVASRFISKFPGIIDGVWAFLDMDGDVTATVYEARPDLTGETLVTSIDFDKDVRAVSSSRLLWAPLPIEVVMKPNWAYYSAWKGRTATSSQVAYGISNSAVYHQAFGGGMEMVHVERVTPGTGAWTEALPVVAFVGFRFRGAQYPVRSAGMQGGM